MYVTHALVTSSVPHKHEQATTDACDQFQFIRFDCARPVQLYVRVAPVSVPWELEARHTAHVPFRPDAGRGGSPLT